MIFFWNRQEVYVGNSMRRFSEIREILAQRKIEYTYKLVNHESARIAGSNRSMRGNAGESLENSTIYYVYVNKKDYDQAVGSIHQIS